MDNEKTLEDAFEALDRVIERLEDKEATLEDSFSYYKNGMELLKFCEEKLDLVEKNMQVIDETGELHEF